jgi:hypothetical protein
MANYQHEPEIIQSWIFAQQRGELTLRQFASKLGCDEVKAQALVDTAYSEENLKVVDGKKHDTAPVSADFDTPLEDQIVRYGDGPDESSIIMPSFAKAFGDIADPKYFKGSGDLMHAGGRSQFLKNPSEDDIRRFFSRADMKDGGVRTTKDADGNLYMWNAQEGTHKQFHMGLEDQLDKDIEWDQGYWNNHTEQLYPEFDATEIAARHNQGVLPLNTSAERMAWVKGKSDRKSAYNANVLT